MRPADWQASWVGARIGARGPDPLLRKEVVLPARVARARAYVVGLGNYELYLNGRRVGNRVLDPAFTDYRRRVLYSTFDVTSLLKPGRNAVGIALGRGRYALTTPNVWNFHTAPWRGDPRALLRIAIWFADGTRGAITTDGSWMTSSGPTRSDSTYAGEVYDARYARNGWDRPGYRAAGWTPAEVLPAPAGRLQAQAVEPMRVVETFAPVSVTTPKPGVYVADMGRTVAGWVRLHVTGRAGTRVTIRYGERLGADGTVDNDQSIIAAPIQTDTYVLAGTGEEVWEPRFSYKGFQYVELRGLPVAPARSEVEGRVVRSSLAATGDLVTSDGLLNRIHQATLVALAGNLHGIPTDTPVYEKNGWLGDIGLLAETAMLNFDAARFLTKWVADMRDAQAPSGLVPVLAPSAGYGYRDAQEWASQSVILPWLLYVWYGDTRVLGDSYDAMKAYVDLEARTWPSGIADSFIGDWNAPGYTRPPEKAKLTATAYYYLAARILADTAEALGQPADAARYARLRDHVRAAFVRRFFDPRTNTFATPTAAGYRQTSNAIALTFGLVPPDRRQAVAANLAADVRGRSHGHLDTGIVGTKE
ncbi:MAG: family 78 glycoside hydrolase catalytic domain, partial [Sporichthyaceae bacterium]|nr:family 78 glycoside hydrolase catalytic domain [Sporichthyaceae bacterium]